MSFKDLIEIFEKRREEYENRFVNELKDLIEKYKRRRVENLISLRERILRELKK
ncbi:MAG: hypothetical protein ABWJ42_04830 [Sulfolobales archaeon]